MSREQPAVQPLLHGFETAPQKEKRGQNPGCGTSGGGWKNRGGDPDLLGVVRRFPKNGAQQNVVKVSSYGRVGWRSFTTASRRTEREVLTSRGSLQANAPIHPQTHCPQIPKTSVGTNGRAQATYGGPFADEGYTYTYKKEITTRA